MHSPCLVICPSRTRAPRAAFQGHQPTVQTPGRDPATTEYEMGKECPGAGEQSCASAADALAERSPQQQQLFLSAASEQRWVLPRTAWRSTVSFLLPRQTTRDVILLTPSSAETRRCRCCSAKSLINVKIYFSLPLSGLIQGGRDTEKGQGGEWGAHGDRSCWFALPGCAQEPLKAINIAGTRIWGETQTFPGCTRTHRHKLDTSVKRILSGVRGAIDQSSHRAVRARKSC